MAGTTGLQPAFKRQVEAVMADPALDGKAYIVSGLRSKSEQVALRIKNGCPDIYTAPASACRVPTAIPGRSQHEKGLAVDFGLRPPLTWAKFAPVAQRHGLAATVAGEPWHWEPAGDRTSVLAFDASPTNNAGDDQADDDGGGGGSSLTRIARALRLLVDPALWLRVVTVLAGLALVAAAIVVLRGDQLLGALTP